MTQEYSITLNELLLSWKEIRFVAVFHVGRYDKSVFKDVTWPDSKVTHVSEIISGPLRHTEEVTLLDRQRQHRLNFNVSSLRKLQSTMKLGLFHDCSPLVPIL
jgi:hypothetical protein